MSTLRSIFSFFKKKLTFFVITLIVLTVSFTGLQVWHFYFADNQKFDRLCTELAGDFFSSDAFTLAFLFEDAPQADVPLPVYDRKTYLQEASHDHLSELRTIDVDRLSEENALFYDILLDYFTRHAKDCDFLYLDQPLSPTGGVQTNLPVLLAEFPITDKNDICLYLDILKAIPEYLNGLGEYEKDRKAAGILMPTDSVNQVISQCDRMCSADGYELFMDGFSNHLDQVSDLSEPEKELFESECDRIITTMIFPAYEKLGDTLLLLREEGVDEKGLFYSGHTDYYEYLMSLKTGSDKSVAEIEKMLEERFRVLASDFNSSLSKISESTDIPQPDIMTGTPEEILNCLKARMRPLFPPLPKEVTCSIHCVPDCLLNYTAPAYYFTPQADNYHNNSIYINEQDITDDLSLFTTLAHEGYPGHMLQSTYFLANEKAKITSSSPALTPTDKCAMRMAMNYIGYVEGWAMYVELLSYDYAASAKDPVNDLSQKYCTLMKLSRELKICLYCMLDIRVHYHGDEAKDLVPYLNNIGIRDDESINAIYSYLINEPATYASYYVGFLELLDCKSLYQKYCGKAGVPYSDRAFHEFYLKCGPCSFSHLRKRIMAFVPD